jgi:hypothetical protein
MTKGHLPVKGKAINTVANLPGNKPWSIPQGLRDGCATSIGLVVQLRRENEGNFPADRQGQQVKAPGDTIRDIQLSELVTSTNVRLGKTFRQWVFTRGMLFMAPVKWWGEQSERAHLHEGVDFRFYQNAEGQVCSLYPETSVPAIFHGSIVAIIPDYIGKSIIVEHPRCGDGDSPTLLSIYGHVTPLPVLSVGRPVEGGEVIATIVSFEPSKKGAQPHLHLSLVSVAGNVDYDSLDWPTIVTSDSLSFLDPLAMAGPYRVVDHTDLGLVVPENLP